MLCGWRWLGPIIMSLTSLMMLAGDTALPCGVQYGDDRITVGVHLTFPYGMPVSFNVTEGGETYTIRWGLQWTVFRWIMITLVAVDSLVLLLHVLRYRSTLAAISLLVSSVILWLLSILLRVFIYTSLLVLFKDIPCLTCQTGK